MESLPNKHEVLGSKPGTQKWRRGNRGFYHVSIKLAVSAPHQLLSSFLKASQPVFTFPLYWVITKNVISHFLQAMFLEHVLLTAVLPRELHKLSINSSCFPGSLYQPQPFPSRQKPTAQPLSKMLLKLNPFVPLLQGTSLSDSRAGFTPASSWWSTLTRRCPSSVSMHTLNDFTVILLISLFNFHQDCIYPSSLLLP